MRAERFTYTGYDVDPGRGELVCRYLLDDRPFEEVFSFGPGGDWDAPEVRGTARLLYLLAGVSYYKAGAPPVVALGATAASEEEAAFLRRFYVDGLAEFAFRNGIDLADLDIRRHTGAEPPADRPADGPAEPPADQPIDRPADRPAGPVAAGGWPPLIPFGGGIDSIVTVEGVARSRPGAALFVVSRKGDRFEPIEAAAAVTGLPVVRCERSLDPQVLRSAELGLLNGHVPVTGIVSAAACVAAALGGFGAVVMSNELSATSPNFEHGGTPVNHQWSKGIDFEAGFSSVLAAAAPGIAYFSWLRARSELWVGDRFAALRQYHRVFRSCNRAFHVDPQRRLDHWCGECDKCCFVDLVLAPFIDRSELEGIFSGREPLSRPELAGRFRTLAGLSLDPKPFECVGDVEECRVALRLAAERPDRAASELIRTLVAELPPAGAPLHETVAAMMAPGGPSFVPDAYAALAQLV